MKVLLLLVYLMNGDVVVEKHYYGTHEACQAEGEKRVGEVVIDPKFDSGLFAGCVDVKAQEVRK